MNNALYHFQTNYTRAATHGRQISEVSKNVSRIIVTEDIMDG